MGCRVSVDQADSYPCPVEIGLSCAQLVALVSAVERVPCCLEFVEELCEPSEQRINGHIHRTNCVIYGNWFGGRGALKGREQTGGNVLEAVSVPGRRHRVHGNGGRVVRVAAIWTRLGLHRHHPPTGCWVTTTAG